jgi:hypothetical protein
MVWDPSKPRCQPEVIAEIAEKYRDDPGGYFADILNSPGDTWQIEVAESVRDYKRNAVSSGHGIGKTREAAMIIHWFMATRPNPAVVATANTEQQLEKKLWRELKIVNDGAWNKDWFEWKAKTFTAFGDIAHQAVAIPWSEANSEAFAGTHSEHVLGVFDESSGIARIIFNVFQGAMTTAGARWLALGNPTKNEGFFFDAAHGKLAAKKPGDIGEGKWKSHIIPSTASKWVDPASIEVWRSQYGEDSDEYRVRVLGLPPRFDASQFIDGEMVKAAQARRLDMFYRWPLILGVDVGHTNDRSVILPRRGRIVPDAIRVLRGMRTTDFARRIIQEIKYYREDHGLEPQVIVEEIGMGIGVVETLQDSGYADQVWGINTGTKSSDPELYANLRCEMWASAKEWLEGIVELPDHMELYDDVTNIRRKPSGSANKLQLETKDQMRARRVPSPDVGDALALTFAVEFDLLPERRHDLWRDDDRSLVGAGGSWMGN